MRKMSNMTAAIVAAAFFIPMPLLAASDSDDAYAKRAELKRQIKAMNALRREIPLPPAAGLFGVYALPEKGQFVTGINFQNFKFSGLLKGSDSVSAATVATSAPNIFFGKPMQPPTLRVVPLKADAKVAFPFINYAVNEKVALVALAPIIKKETVLETFKGGGGAVSLGTNTVTSSGLGDIKLGMLYNAYRGYNKKERQHNVHFDAVLSVPTGSITEEDTQLTPANTKRKARLAYGMQLGSGTFDALLGVAYWGKQKQWGWGAQYLATLPLESENSEGWRYGDKHEGTVWLSYSWQPTLVSSLRLRHESQGRIRGQDAKIFGPGLGANPDNYGGTRTEVFVGVNWMYKPARNISFEFSTPLEQDRNGVQLENDYSFMFSWRNAIF